MKQINIQFPRKLSFSEYGNPKYISSKVKVQKNRRNNSSEETIQGRELYEEMF